MLSAIMLMLFQIIIISGIVYLIYKGIRGSLGSGGKISDTGSMICPSCGTRGEPKKITRGSIGIEIVLWLCFIIPGIIYSLWRSSSRQPGCPSCGHGMIGISTPNGRLLVEKLRT